MLSRHQYLWTAIFITIFVSTSVLGQFTCKDFLSPKTLMTDGTRLGTIVYPLAGNKYPPNQNCEWDIETAISGSVVKLKITSSNLQDIDIRGECSMDYVDIFDWKYGDRDFLGRFCGSQSGQIYESTGQKMTVQFTSNVAAEFSGFSASYQAVEERGDELDSSTTIILAICIPVGVLLIVLTIPFSWKMFKLYRQKHTRNTDPNQGQGVQLTENDNRAYSDYSFHHAQLGLVSPGERSYGIQHNFPPPAYDSLEYSNLPPQPPPYEQVIKEMVSEDRRDESNT
ncbi:G-protein coupled receptor 126 [Biomphalaria glabrata]|nr:G-protein coupled receptor 126 [Biomphalaria glabrata]